MKVVFLCKNDWANVACTFSKSLNKIGVDSKSFSAGHHKFVYPESSFIYSKSSKIDVEEADVVVFVHSYLTQTGVDLSKKIVAVMHAGSAYRQGHKKINQIFDPIVDITFCGSDVLGFNPKNEVCMQAAVDTEYFQPMYSDFTNRKNVIIGHYPTSAKGYEIIERVINRLKKFRKNIEFRYDNYTVLFNDHIKRISECDIYIEDMSDNQHGIPLTTFGITTLECGALGKVVCTRFPDLPIYEKLFGKCGIQVANNEQELEEKLKWLTSMNDEDFLELQKSTRKWIEERHSLEVIGNWLKDHFEKIKK
jgi:hypothetical protein